MGDYFQLTRLIDVAGKIIPYLNVTFQIVFVAILFGSLLGIIVAILRIKRIPVVWQILSIYISFMRGTPMLAQLMLIYYGMPMLLYRFFGLDINTWEKILFVEITFILNEGAFLGEIFRASIEAVPAEQTDAGYSVGLNRFQTFFRIVFPQAVKIAIPTYCMDILSIFHNTSLAFMLGVTDIVGRAKAIGASSGHVLEAYIFVAILYVVFSILFQLFFKQINQKLNFGEGQ